MWKNVFKKSSFRADHFKVGNAKFILIFKIITCMFL